MQEAERQEQGTAAAPPSPGSVSSRVPKAPDGSVVTLEPQTETYTYTAKDGVSYEWDPVPGAWFPMFREDLVSSQQSAYTFAGAGGGASLAPPRLPHAPAPARSGGRKRRVPPTDDATAAAAEEGPAPKPRPNRSIFVSGLGPDTAVAQLHELFSKYGILQEDVETGEPRIRMYRHPVPPDAPPGTLGAFKGEALITYFREESVDLAIQLMDGVYLSPTDKQPISVSKAVFDKTAKDPAAGAPGVANSAGGGGRGSTDPGARKRFQKAMERMNKKLDWAEEDETSSAPPASRVVILKHMFTLAELEQDVTLLVELPTDVREECEKMGPVTNVTIFDLEKEGVMTVRFKTGEAATACVKRMNGRFFGGRRITAELSQSKLKFRKSSSKGPATQEGEEEEQRRLAAYEAWLEGEH